MENNPSLPPSEPSAGSNNNGHNDSGSNHPGVDFTSSDFARLLRSKDALFSSSEFSDLLKSKDMVFNSSDFANLMKSREILGKTGGPSSSSSVDPSNLFRTADFLKSLDSWRSKDSVVAGKQPAVAAAAVPPAAAKKADMFTSRDWMSGYEPGHVDISYDKSLFKSGDNSKAAAAAAPNNSMTSSDSVGKWLKFYEDGLGSSTSAKAAASPFAAPPMPAPAAMAPSWSDVYNNVLSNPMQIADDTVAGAVPMPPLSGVAALPTTPAAAAVKSEPNIINNNNNIKKAAAKPKKKRIYKSRKVIPDTKEYVDYTDNDVLLGRGGLSNKHPGNRRYRQEIEDAKAVYRSASKDEKTQWAELLVASVRRYGGRFLEKDKDNGRWYIVPDIVARRKAGQALREDNTPESRKDKRERYKMRHNKGWPGEFSFIDDVATIRRKRKKKKNYMILWKGKTTTLTVCHQKGFYFICVPWEPLNKGLLPFLIFGWPWRLLLQKA